MRLRPLSVVLASVLALAACGPSGDAATAPSEPRPQGTVSPEEADGADATPSTDLAPDPVPPEPETVQPPPSPAGYELLEDETGAPAKRAAVDLVEALTTYEAGDTIEEVVAGATDDAALRERLVDGARPLHHEEAWSRGQVVYPQLGGLEKDAIAVIVVVRQEVTERDGSSSVVTRTLDVRVDRVDERWVVSDLASAGGEPVPRPDPIDPLAAAVLDDERIELPDTAVWDIHRGDIDDRLLALMARMAERTPYGVVVLRTGHSREVFGTDRISRHAEGRAVDLYRLDGPAVLEDRSTGSATYELVRWLYEQPELSEVGSPWALDEFGGRSFSDELHQDHVHVGVLRPGERQRSSPRV